MQKKKKITSGESAALRLYSRANTCYNPDCHEALLTERNGLTIVNHEIAHIRDEFPPSNPNSDIGWRYYPDDLTHDQRNVMSNFIMLCSPCHKLIDRLKPREYSVELLLEWKKMAEGESVGTVTLGVITPDVLLDAIQEYFSRAVELKNSFDASMVTTAIAQRNTIKTPKSFPSRPGTVESPEKSTKRATTLWPPFAGAACSLITFEIINYTNHPIHEIVLKIDWRDRVYWMHDIVKVPINYERISKFYYQKTEDLKDVQESTDWVFFRFADDILSFPHVAPKATHTIQLHRIVKSYSFIKPKLTLTYKDNSGNTWKRVNNDMPERI